MDTIQLAIICGIGASVLVTYDLHKHWSRRKKIIRFKRLVWEVSFLKDVSPLWVMAKEIYKMNPTFLESRELEITTSVLRMKENMMIIDVVINEMNSPVSTQITA